MNSQFWTRRRNRPVIASATTHNARPISIKHSLPIDTSPILGSLCSCSHANIPSSRAEAGSYASRSPNSNPTYPNYSCAVNKSEGQSAAIGAILRSCFQSVWLNVATRSPRIANNCSTKESRGQNLASVRCPEHHQITEAHEAILSQSDFKLVSSASTLAILYRLFASIAVTWSILTLTNARRMLAV